MSADDIMGVIGAPRCCEAKPSLGAFPWPVQADSRAYGAPGPGDDGVPDKRRAFRFGVITCGVNLARRVGSGIIAGRPSAP